MTNMFNKIIAFFENAQEIKDERFKAFNEFHTWCVKSFPYGLRKELVTYKISPVADPKSDYLMSFEAKDVLWWKGKYVAENFLIKPIEEIKNDTMKACLEIIDRLRLTELDEKTRALYESILNDSL